MEIDDRRMGYNEYMKRYFPRVYAAWEADSERRRLLGQPAILLVEFDTSDSNWEATP